MSSITNMTVISDYIQERLTQLDITQADLARASGVSGAEVSRIISGFRKRPGQELLARIAPTLRVSAEELYRIAGYHMSGPPSPTTTGDVDLSRAVPVGPVVFVPVYGTIRAGEPMLAAQDIIDSEAVDADEYQEGDFWLVVKGNSMEPETRCLATVLILGVLANTIAPKEKAPRFPEGLGKRLTAVHPTGYASV
jgi:repressor LexA